jgi:SAM-dependent methyltransferase
MEKIKASQETKRDIACPLCAESDFSYLFQKKGRDFYRCNRCGIELQNPLPTISELSAYYDASFESGMYQTFVAASDMKIMTARRRLKEIARFVPFSGRWLDVGCANGVFVEAANELGMQAEGVELSRNAVRIGRERGLDLHSGTLDDLPNLPAYDVICAFDVLEHVLDPKGFFAAAVNRLKGSGYLVVTVPDAGGLVKKLMGKNWYFYIPEEHLHYFNRRNLAQLAVAHGLDVVDVGATYKPMTYNYALTQFAEYNPLIYRGLKLPSFLMPQSVREWTVPLPIGEIRMIGRKPK